MVVDSEAEISEQICLWDHAMCATQPESPSTCVNVSHAADVEKLKNTRKTNVDIRRDIAVSYIKLDSTQTQKLISYFQNKNAVKHLNAPLVLSERHGEIFI